MKSFSDICKDFFSTNNCNDLLGQLQTLDKIGHETIGDYHAVGCEIILSGMNTGNEYFNLAELMESYFNYDNVMRHWFNFINDWDTFLFYSPSDYRGFIFDFSNLYKNGKIICYNGLNGPKNLEKVTEYTIDQFLIDYGLSTFYSISHWNVNWKRIGINWNN